MSENTNPLSQIIDSIGLTEAQQATVMGWIQDPSSINLSSLPDLDSLSPEQQDMLKQAVDAIVPDSLDGIADMALGAMGLGDAGSSEDEET